MRMSGVGHYSSELNRTGDVHVNLKLVSDGFFGFKGSDLICKIPISLDKAIFGGTIEVPTLHGDVGIRIPPQCKHGTQIRLKEKGLQIKPDLEIYGDLYVEIEISLPTIESAKEIKFDDLEYNDIKSHEKKVEFMKKKLD
jgi:curved DNA-binding protein